ncbi:hypothetical protein OHB12_08360 [Nocardia sp. NBC_01730]|uniref:hypothetical protein n=1 Tax=Nocardia sp. NBC_01730 TaxID=2975998 RepID=UPI002E0D2B31|nr:hypothetical protein OHB12_08360 [Nocardia sp. NBC_01730]
MAGNSWTDTVHRPDESPAQRHGDSGTIVIQVPDNNFDTDATAELAEIVQFFND